MFNPTLKMLLNSPEGEKWSPTEREQSVRHRHSKKMDLTEVENKVGFRFMQPHIEKTTLISTSWVEGFTDYYGEFSDGISGKYRLGDNNNTYFVVEQYRIINSDTPEIFNYPESIRAYQKYLNNGLATIVLMPREWAIPFIQWVSGDVMIQILFSWSVDDFTAETIVNSLKVEE